MAQCRSTCRRAALCKIQGKSAKPWALACHLSKAGVRGKEMAVRFALGAGGRLIRQLMIENLLMGLDLCSAW